MSAVKVVCWIAVVLALPLSCYHRASRDAFQSNFSQVRVAGGRLVAAGDGSPYSGTLIARDREITAIAHMVLDGTPLERAATLDPSGLILVLPISHGVPEGRAILRADLRSPRLGEYLVERGDLRSLKVAREVIATVELAEATFKGGKLDGPAVVFQPGKSGRTSRLAEVGFRNNLLHGVATEYFRGTSQPRRQLGFDRGVQSGPARTYHASGALESESSYVAGVLHGDVKEYYADGSQRLRARYHRGEPVDRKERWYPTGQRQWELVYEPSGARETEWYSNGKLKSRTADQDQTRYPPDGLIVEYHRSGAVHTRTHYVAGVKHGPFEVFYSTGQRWEAGEFEHGKQRGAHHKWWTSGRPALEATWVAGELHGSYKRWYADGRAWELATYEGGKLSGRYQKWWKNGAVAHDYSYRSGKIDGDYRTYYDSGKPWAVGAYSAGKPQGTFQRWFPDGRLGYIMHHRNGRPDGPHRRWYADGKPRLEATYLNGELDGAFKNWLEDGTVYELATFQRGLKTATTRKDPAGSSERE